MDLWLGSYQIFSSFQFVDFIWSYATTSKAHHSAIFYQGYTVYCYFMLVAFCLCSSLIKFVIVIFYPYAISI